MYAHKKYRTQIAKYITEILDIGVNKENLRVIHAEDTYCKSFGRMGEAVSEHVGIWAEIRKNN